jgi:hypothetical protein
VEHLQLLGLYGPEVAFNTRLDLQMLAGCQKFLPRRLHLIRRINRRLRY